MRSKLNRMMSASQPAKHPTPPPSKKEFIIRDRTRPLEPAPDAQDWIIAMVAPRREIDAVSSLREAGYIAWHPQMVVWISSARLRIKAKVNRPLFPRYVFVAQQSGVTQSITDCDHITYLVGPVPTPRRDHPTLLKVLSDRQGGGEFDGTSLRCGETVAMPDDGPFAELRGIILKTEGERVMVLLRILGSDREVSINAAALRKVA